MKKVFFLLLMSLILNIYLFFKPKEIIVIEKPVEKIIEKIKTKRIVKYIKIETKPENEIIETKLEKVSIKIKNGDKIDGFIIKTNEEYIYIKNDFGEFEIDKDDVWEIKNNEN